MIKRLIAVLLLFVMLIGSAYAATETGIDSVTGNGQNVFMLDRYLKGNTWLDVFVVIVLLVFSVVLPKNARACLFVLYCGFICYMTLIGRENRGTGSSFELFWSYRHFFDSAEMRKDIIQNFILFVPFGALLVSLTGKWSSILWGIALSVVIELAQYVFKLGFCDLDDIVSNGLGTVIGVAITMGCNRLLRVRKKRRKPAKGYSE